MSRRTAELFQKIKEGIMTKQELLKTPQFLDKIDIMKMFDCCEPKALSLIRSIKSVSDRAGLKGKVTITDYNEWYNHTVDNLAVCKE